VPDITAPYVAICLQRNTLNVELMRNLRGSEGPLNLLIEQHRFKAEGEGEWNAVKHGGTQTDGDTRAHDHTSDRI